MTIEARIDRLSLGIMGLALLSSSVGAGCVSAETHTTAGSTATIQQSGGGTSKTEVRRYPDGQTIITQDGVNTDVTVQRGTSSTTTMTTSTSRSTDPDRFGASSLADRPAASGTSRASSLSSQEAFRQQMLDRLR